MTGGGLTQVPRAATLASALTCLSHLWAATTGLSERHWVPSWQWALSAAAALVLTIVVATRPDYFRLRDFRLGGVAVIALSALVLIPLPGTVRRYDESIPLGMMPSIAGALLVLAIVFALAPKVPHPSRRRTTAIANEDNFALIVVAAAIVLFPIWLRSLGTVPIVALIRGDAAGVEVALLRFDALRGLGAVPLRLAIGAIRNVYLLFAIAFLVASWRLTRHGPQRSARGLVAIAAFGVAAVYAVVTTERAILGQVVVVALIAWLLASGAVLTMRILAAMGVLGLLFPFVFAVFNSASADGSAFSGAIGSIERRLFFTPGDVLVQYFILFPARRPFLGGSSVPKVSRLFGQETFDLSGYVARIAYPRSAEFGNANASFLGYGWANFGTAGVLAWTLVTAVTLVALEALLRRLPTRTAIALRAAAVVQAALLSSQDINRTLLGFTPGFLDLVIVAVIALALDRRRRGPSGAGGGPAPELHVVDARRGPDVGIGDAPTVVQQPHTG